MKAKLTPIEKTLVQAIYREIMNESIRISTTTEHDMFVMFHPHIQRIDCEIHRCGYVSGFGPTSRFGAYLYPKEENDWRFTDGVQETLEISLIKFRDWVAEEVEK